MVDEEIERILTVPLRRTIQKVPRTKRSPRAIAEIKSFVARHMKSKPERVWIAPQVNEAIWARGIQKPPKEIRVKAVKFTDQDDPLVEVSLPEE